MCKDNHYCETPAVNFICQDTRCGTCARESGNCNGYYPERADEKDYLYIMDIVRIATKVGRSFDVSSRAGNIKREIGLPHKPEILQAYTATHQVIYDTEQTLHAELRERGFQYYCDWTNECFTKDCWFILQEILEDYVNSGTLERIT